jgi:hypothetical protein
LFVARRIVKMGKRAIITVELVDESIINSNDTIAKELLSWLAEGCVPAPWIKQVHKVEVKSI